MSQVTLLKPHTKDLGGFEVRRLLPGHPHQMVGPFIFFDHMGPAQLAAGTGVDVRPHPHIGLATVTYLFEGSFMHRDSLGTVQRIEPGAVNWMTAGRGIAHSERSPDDLRPRGPRLHGIQTWVALPLEHEQCEPAFSHHPKDTIPLITMPGVYMHLIAGTAYGRTSPTPTYSPIFYLAVEMEAGASLELPRDHEERAVYVVSGDVEAGGAPIPAHHLAVASASESARITAHSAARVMLLGGASLGERRIWWNFVASSDALIDEAAQRWRAGGFAPVPGETEFIPLPEDRAPHTTFVP
ncbi:MAG: pirin-like protein [Betaproteobacteria bacterium]|nr:pirin-like protein [Betaproteobacteria bacterium]